MPCMRRTLSCLSLVYTTRWAGLFSLHCTLASAMRVCAYMRASILFFTSLLYLEYHTLGAHACLFISLCLFFASVGHASARIVARLTSTLFTSLLTHRLVLLCVDAHCFICWDLPGDVLAAPGSALCGWIGLTPLSLSLSLSFSLSFRMYTPTQRRTRSRAPPRPHIYTPPHTPPHTPTRCGPHPPPPTHTHTHTRARDPVSGRGSRGQGAGRGVTGGRRPTSPRATSTAVTWSRPRRGDPTD